MLMALKNRQQATKKQNFILFCATFFYHLNIFLHYHKNFYKFAFYLKKIKIVFITI